jgi:type VI secretion system secreted protein VgrG
MARVLIAETPLGREVLVARSMSGHEELGRLPEFQLEFRSPRGDIKPSEILGKNISWAIELPNNKARYFNGFVTHFAEAGEDMKSENEKSRKGVSYIYRATVNPWLWFLTLRSNCRIFQPQKTVLEIADELFEDYKQLKDVKKVQLRTDYPKRDFVVQYRETDFNFICRLFEQEGIYFGFEYDNGKNTLVLMDSLGAHSKQTKDLTGVTPLTVPFDSHGTAQREGNTISEWHVNRQIQPGKYTIADFNYEKPRVALSGEGIVKESHDLAEFEMYDYPGEYEQPADGTQYAKTRIEELHVRYEQFAGSGDVRVCAPGLLLKLQDHTQQAYNAEYLVTAVSYEATAGGMSSGAAAGGEFHCSLSAIAGKTPFRPARITPKPVIQGPQTATVVGPAGEEIYTDEHGRIKVEFHWDRYSPTNENSSCWVRVAQPLAGKGWGFLALPRIGHEVVIDFLEGDPDDPLVTGSVYNADLKPPYKLPDEKTRSGLKTLSSKGGGVDNFNELRFDDNKGKELIYIQAEKDKHIRIKNDRLEWVGRKSHLRVKDDDFEWLYKDHHVKVDHDRNEKIGNVLSLDIAKDLHGKMGTKLCLDAGKEIHLKAGSTLVLESGTTLTLKVGSNHVTIDQQGVSIQGTKIEVKADATISIDGAMTKINSGASPSSAATGSGASPQEAKDADEAGKSEGGEMTKPQKRQKPTTYSPQAQMFKMAANGGTPFCEICNC